METEPSGPGLKITSFISNSSDVLGGIFAAPSGKSLPDVRIYPTDLVRKTEEGTHVRKYNAIVGDPGVEYPNGLIEALNCVTWATVDLTVYGAIGLDEVWIETDESGKGIGVELRGFGAKLERSDQ